MRASHWGAQLLEVGWRVHIPTVANYPSITQAAPFLGGLAANMFPEVEEGCNVEMSTIVQVHGITVTPGAPIAIPKEKVQTNLLLATGSLLAL